jgi:hypothetical protein
MLRFINEAVADNIQRVVIGGGDGSLNEALNALMQQPQQANSLEIAVLPLGTAENPNELKNFLGGGAYTLVGLAKALGFKPYQGSITTEKAPSMAILWSAPFVIISRQAADKCWHLRH